MNLPGCPFPKRDTGTRFPRDSPKLALVRVARLVLPPPNQRVKSRRVHRLRTILITSAAAAGQEAEAVPKFVRLDEVERPAAPNLGLLELCSPLAALCEDDKREAARAPTKELCEAEALGGDARQVHGRTFMEHRGDVYTNDVVARVEDLFADAEKPTLARLGVPNVEHRRE